MTRKEKESARVRLMQIVTEVRESYGYRRDDALDEIATRFAASDDLLAALRIAGVCLYSEKFERLGRKDGLRPGYAVKRNGQTCSLALLEQIPREARISVRRELDHAHSSLVQAEWDWHLLGIAEGRMCERGIDPDTTEMILATFVDEDEARFLYREWFLKRQA